MLARARKAVVGAALGGLGTGIAWLAKAGLDGAVNGNDVGQAAAAALAAALATLAAVYQTRNAGVGNGSDPRYTGGGGSTVLR